MPQPPAVSNFDFARDYLKLNEGKFSNHPDDPGGPTNFGITRATLSAWRGHPVSVDDVRKMHENEATAIIKNNYWILPGLDYIKSRVIATCLLDQGVLNGPGTAIRYAQLAANNAGASIAVDGSLGPETLGAFDEVDLAKFMRAYNKIIHAHYDAIVASHPSQRVFYSGWIRRADRLLALS
jgi:lysozyme family protein